MQCTVVDTVPLNILDTPTHSRIFHFRKILRTSKLWNNTNVVTKKELKQIKIYCLDDSFAHACHYLKKLHLECFSNSLERFPHMLSTCWVHFLHSVVRLIPNHLNWVEVGWLWRPGHLMQHSITLLLCQIGLTQPGGMLGYCPVEKQIIVSLSVNQMGWRITAECCCCHTG